MHAVHTRSLPLFVQFDHVEHAIHVESIRI